MKVSEVLEKALERFGPNGSNWCQYRYHEKDSHCMQGAVHLVIPGDGIAQAKCWDVLIKVLPESAGNPIARWNDSLERKFPEVKAAFQKAIALARQEESLDATTATNSSKA